jgi:hypothetical protein
MLICWNIHWTTKEILQIPSVTAVCTDNLSSDKPLHVTGLEGRIDVNVNLKPCGKAAYRITVTITTAQKCWLFGRESLLFYYCN